VLLDELVQQRRFGSAAGVPATGGDASDYGTLPVNASGNAAAFDQKYPHLAGNSTMFLPAQCFTMKETAPHSHSIVAGGLPEMS
jgi:hypothetical protein